MLSKNTTFSSSQEYFLMFWFWRSENCFQNNYQKRLMHASIRIMNIFRIKMPLHKIIKLILRRNTYLSPTPRCLKMWVSNENNEKNDYILYM